MKDNGLAKSIQAMRDGKAPLPPYDRHMGFRLIDADAQGVTLSVEANTGFANPTGVLHGGVLVGLCDSAMGITASGLAGPGQTTTNTDLTMRFFRPTTTGTLTAKARIVRHGRRVLAMECDVTDVEGKLVARASSTFLFLEG